MNVPDVKWQPVSSEQKPFTNYLVLSMIVHAVLITGMASSAWWLNRAKRYTPASHTVSLVDAPSTLRPVSQAGQGKATGNKTASGVKRPSSQPTKSIPQSKTTRRLQAPSKSKVTPAKTVQTPKVKKPTKAVTSRSTRAAKPKTQRKAKQTASAIKPRSTTKPLASTSRTKRQKETKPSRRSQTPVTKTKTKAGQVQQQAAEQRLTALRSRYGKYGESTTGAEATESLQHVRLRAYQELVREQIVDAWVLPLLQDTARNLQATALLTVDREGRITQLEILKNSNNPLFDESLIRAIRQVAPLPALPDDYRGTFLELELHFAPSNT